MNPFLENAGINTHFTRKPSQSQITVNNGLQEFVNVNILLEGKEPCKEHPTNAKTQICIDKLANQF